MTRRRLAGTAITGILLLLGILVAAYQTRDGARPAPSAGPGAESAPGETIDAMSCARQVASMPIRDRLAQRLMVGVDPADPGGAISVVRTAHVGGIFIGGTATQILLGDHLRALQEAARTPVAVAVDDEGGRVQRIGTVDGAIPSARAMAGSLSPEQVRQLAHERGNALRAHGVTIDLAPVVDVSDQPATAVIGDRSFSPDPGITTTYAGAFASGLRDAGVLPVLKHFPGHGRATGDSHRGVVTTPALDDLQ
ncbi:MAG TPA: glycoside hydrolase family 3 N-terminal domain-containing protein, partial [Pseudonocardiaceae bacterium]|nr:glycoside hydrolase family 3 N-terminal domain-containing protein [Pseudonocardiaceae bacterium]